MNINADQLHRVAKMALDTGEAETVQDAMRIFSSYQLAIEVGPEISDSPTLQAALLTSVNCARRCFLGGVFVSGELDVPLLVHWRSFETLEQAISDLQGRRANSLSTALPRIVLGSRASQDHPIFGVKATFDGWTAGVMPLADGQRLPEKRDFVPAGVFSGSLAVSEAFQFVRGRNPAAGRRDVALSLWRPEQNPWQADPGPLLEKLPTKLWLIGLGHLGQAYLWTLGLLPYSSPQDVELVLQDYEELVEANDSTSLLTHTGLLGQKKTRAMSDWCERRGFRTRVVERHFSDDFKINATEPSVALCGVDNAPARAALEGPGFERIVEAGLGRGPDEFLGFQIHTFPGERAASKIWPRHDQVPPADEIVNLPAYRSLAENGLDHCGLTLLAGRTVGAPFVGAAVSALVIAELLRMTLGDQQYELIDGNLRSLEHRIAIPADNRLPFNPGSTLTSHR